MMRWKRGRRTEPPAPTVEPVTPTSGALSLRDFTVTVDVEHSGGDRLVLHLDRPGQSTLHMQVHVTQLMWLIDDPAMFAQAYEARANWADPYAAAPAEPVGVTA